MEEERRDEETRGKEGDEKREKMRREMEEG